MFCRSFTALCCSIREKTLVHKADRNKSTLYFFHGICPVWQHCLWCGTCFQFGFFIPFCNHSLLTCHETHHSYFVVTKLYMAPGTNCESFQLCLKSAAAGFSQHWAPSRVRSGMAKTWGNDYIKQKKLDFTAKQTHHNLAKVFILHKLLQMLSCYIHQLNCNSLELYLTDQHKVIHSVWFINAKISNMPQLGCEFTLSPTEQILSWIMAATFCFTPTITLTDCLFMFPNLDSFTTSLTSHSSMKLRLVDSKTDICPVDRFPNLSSVWLSATPPEVLHASWVFCLINAVLHQLRNA